MQASGQVTLGFADINGARLWYEATGVGEPLVLIPGYTLDATMWDDQAPAFAERYRVIRYDMRGFGKSSLPDGSEYAHCDDLHALLAHLDIDRAHILGLSLGGAVAVEFALVYPEATTSLILADVSGLDGFFWPEQLQAWFDAIFSAGRSGDIALAKRRWMDTDWFTPARTKPDVAKKLERILSEYSGWHFANDNPVRGLTPPANERLSEINAPTLVILGELDLPFYNHPLADRLAEGIAGAQKVVMPGVGHMSNLEDPEEFNRIVLGFLRGY